MDLILTGYYRGKRKTEECVRNEYSHNGISLRPGMIVGPRPILGGRLSAPLHWLCLDTLFFFNFFFFMTYTWVRVLYFATFLFANTLLSSHRHTIQTVNSTSNCEYKILQVIQSQQKKPTRKIKKQNKKTKKKSMANELVCACDDS